MRYLPGAGIRSAAAAVPGLLFCPPSIWPTGRPAYQASGECSRTVQPSPESVIDSAWTSWASSGRAAGAVETSSIVRRNSAAPRQPRTG